jgi:hypothetical protein
MSVFDGLSRPMRAAGLGLLAVGVVAAAIGGVTMVTGGGDGSNAAAPAGQDSRQPGDRGGSRTRTTTPGQSTTSATATGSASPSTATGAPSTPRRPGDTSTTGRPGAGRGVHDQQASATNVAVRVYNNSMIHGLAHRAADDFFTMGWNVVEVGNYSGGVIPATTAYYRPGTDEKFAADSLARQFGMRAKPRFPGIADSSAGVIVIVTQDYQSTPQGK